MAKTEVLTERDLKNQAKSLLEISEKLDPNNEEIIIEWKELAELTIIQHRLFEILRGKAI